MVKGRVVNKFITGHMNVKSVAKDFELPLDNAEDYTCMSEVSESDENKR